MEDTIFNVQELCVIYDDDRVMHVQQSDGYYDYTYFFSDGRGFDGGQLDEPDFNILDALDEIEESYNIKTERKSLLLEAEPEDIFGEDFRMEWFYKFREKSAVPRFEYDSVIQYTAVLLPVLIL